MQFSAIRLREWKAFRRADFELPRASKGKSLVLIGARNGYGKTSLLEALIIGLYGTAGRDLVARAESRDGETGKLIGYRQFIERAFNRQAYEEGANRMSVEIVLDVGRKTITVERTWYIGMSDGEPSFKPSDEQLIIYEGRDDDRVPLRVPATQDRGEYLQAYVERHFLQQSLAGFFLFDGERVQRLAESEMATQVRLGIEGLLGISILRRLQQDLERLVVDRRPRDDASASTALDDTRDEADELLDQIEHRQREANDLKRQLGDAEAERTDLMHRQTRLHGDGISEASELNEKRLIQRRELDKCRDELSHILERELPLLVAGNGLRDALAAQITGDQAFRRWQGVIRSGDSLLDNFLKKLRTEHLPLDPALTESQRAALQGWVSKVWTDLHHPPPKDCPSAELHGYLGDEEQIAVLARLSGVAQFASETVGGVLRRIAEAEAELDRVNDQLARLNVVGSKAQDLQTKIEAAFQREKTLSAQLVAAENELSSKRQALATKEQRVAWMVDQRSKNAPQLAIVRRAEAVQGMLTGLIDEAISLYTGRVGKEMTTAYRGIAHKSTVQKVEVDDDCSVRLVAKGGRDFRTLDNSAGENQIFACALIAAVVKASGRDFPIVVDTPLARLDKIHRSRLLQWMAEHTSSQVILLSTDAEVVGDNLEAVRGYVAKAFQVNHKDIDGFGLSRVEADSYFEPVARVATGNLPREVTQ